jgi:large conductance mechanosensitive channel
MKSFFDEFKVFALRGNVVDLAVAVVIGGAFGKIVASLVNDIIMPIMAVVTGGVDFSNLALTLRAASGDTAAVTMNYGLFINAVIGFGIITFTIFMVIKQMNRFLKRERETAVEPPTPTKDQELLIEIRDLLRRPQ